MTRPIHSDGLLHGAVVGVRRDDGRWLLVRRSQHVMAPGGVCFPGGAIEVEEDPQLAAEREIKEELGVEVRILKHVWDYHCPDRPLRLFGYLGELTSHDLQPDEHEVAELLWMSAEEIATHPDVLTGTQDFVSQLEAALNNARG